MPNDKLDNLTMIIPSNFIMKGKELHIDKDFTENLRFYLQKFRTVTVLSPFVPDNNRGMLSSTIPIEEFDKKDFLEFRPLPMPYREDRYLQNLRAVKKELEKHISSADVVLVTPHAPFDWPSFAAVLAINQHKPFALQADWDLWSTSRFIYSENRNPIQYIRKYVWVRLFLSRYGKILKKAAVSLLHGEDVFQANHKRTPNPRLIHNHSIDDSDKISQADLQLKISSVTTNRPMKLVYAGRTEPMKGPLQWVQVLDQLRKRNIPFSASWFGEGSLQSELSQKIDQLDLKGTVTLHGKQPRDQVLDAVRQADVFLFCHNLRESPRNLVEALASGTPIIGFSSPYSTNLTHELGGGDFTSVGDVDALAEKLAFYDAHRSELANLIANAAKSGAQYSRGQAMIERIAYMVEFGTDHEKAVKV